MTQTHPESHADGEETVVTMVRVDVDLHIRPLVDVLNHIPAVRTYASCSGHPGSPRDPRAYVLLDHTGDHDFQVNFFGRLGLLCRQIDGATLEMPTGYLRVPREHIPSLVELIKAQLVPTSTR